MRKSRQHSRSELSTAVWIPFQPLFLPALSRRPPAVVVPFSCHGDTRNLSCRKKQTRRQIGSIFLGNTKVHARRRGYHALFKAGSRPSSPGCINPRGACQILFPCLTDSPPHMMGSRTSEAIAGLRPAATKLGTTVRLLGKPFATGRCGHGEDMSCCRSRHAKEGASSAHRISTNQQRQEDSKRRLLWK